MKREEAIKRLKERIDRQALTLDDEDMAALTELVPELRESEDERIRKALIELVGLVPDYMFGEIKPNKFIAYLEKSKDSKWSPSEDEMGVLYKLCYISNQITDEDDTELTRLYQDLKREYFNGHSFENMFYVPLRKQKEQ